MSKADAVDAGGVSTVCFRMLVSERTGKYEDEIAAASGGCYVHILEKIPIPML